MSLTPENENASTVTARVRLCIAHSGMPQREFAQRIDLEETKLSKALHGNRRFSSDELMRIATTAGVTVSWLLTGSDSSVAVSATPPVTSLPHRAVESPEKAKKRREIVETAWTLFAKKGFHSVRIADIAETCQTSNASVHYYFPTKEDLFAETLRFSVKLAFDRQIASLHTAADPVDRLKHLLDLQLPAHGGETEWSIWLQAWSEISTGAPNAENHRQAYQRWHQTVLSAVQEGQESGKITANPAEDIALHITSLMDGLGIKVLTGLISAEKMRQQLHRFVESQLHQPENQS